ncbi:enoyl-CoA hydratase/isomerase family protein [Desulfosporosinus shakirovi]|uniref:enoyl-CoA hydratase/isomerase family protein n=1 Tax=Desulfosporosinus shakirovi TaxID=2885154 RepID=UPI001E2C000E|nr:enoyl-CoA hydratase/isomerase family protein [Desulfosporosinus sp. SRJS8]MCB8817850.1 enoyl-CoA hydratase/isomerase family protein [Desulfosporosinus sp. SRJS8]
MTEVKTKFEFIKYERKGADGGALWLTLSNPPMKNALNDPMQLELIEALEQIRYDNTIRVIVLTGDEEGDAFCSGGDISLLNKMNNYEGYDYAYQRGNHIQFLLTYMEKPVIAAVNGYCLAGGLELALCADYIYAADNAVFGLMEINLGVLAGWGGMTRLPRRIPVNRAKEMIYTAEMIDADEALKINLVNKVFAKADLITAVEKTVKAILSKPPLAVRAAKTVINDGISCGSIQAAQTIERGMNMWLGNTEDFKEGTTAFLEKRKPVFKGR